MGYKGQVHVVVVGRAIEAAAADLAARARRAVGAATANGERRASIRTAIALTGRVEDALPLWKGARFAAVALGALAGGGGAAAAAAAEAAVAAAGRASASRGATAAAAAGGASSAAQPGRAKVRMRQPSVCVAKPACRHNTS